MIWQDPGAAPGDFQGPPSASLEEEGRLLRDGLAEDVMR